LAPCVPIVCSAALTADLEAIVKMAAILEQNPMYSWPWRDALSDISDIVQTRPHTLPRFFRKATKLPDGNLRKLMKRMDSMQVSLCRILWLRSKNERVSALSCASPRNKSGCAMRVLDVLLEFQLQCRKINSPSFRPLDDILKFPDSNWSVMMFPRTGSHR
jgi:hypothetical protein